MNISIKSALFTFVLALLILATGCQEPQSDMTDKRARLVGNQNLQLKKQLQDKDTEIQRQKELVIKCQDKMEAQQQQHEQAATSMLRIMKSLAGKDARIQQLEAEIATLKGK